MISLVIVNYRSSVLARSAIASARAASSRPLEVVVVDNSTDPAEADALRDLADVLFVSNVNRGYAGAINDARVACTGSVIVVTNPDVVFAAGSIDQLVTALADAAVAGPALFWDDAFQWRLPPGSLTTGLEKAGQILASRSRAWREIRDRRRFRERVEFWSLQQSTEVASLSGAVMAIRGADFDLLGGFDERFALYFEETDFLRRASEMRRKIVYVPSAFCRHVYNQSAGQEPENAAARYAESEMRYLEKWNGPFAARLLKRLERPVFAAGFPTFPGEIHLDRDDVVVEVSPLPGFATAAGHFPRGRTVRIPDEVRSSLRSESLYIRVVERETGAVLYKSVISSREDGAVAT